MWKLKRHTDLENNKGMCHSMVWGHLWYLSISFAEQAYTVKYDFVFVPPRCPLLIFM